MKVEKTFSLELNGATYLVTVQFELGPNGSLVEGKILSAEKAKNLFCSVVENLSVATEAGAG